MGQRKLTDEELQSVMLGRHCLRNVLEFSKHVHYIGVALEQLDAIAIHCTTDGKPWVEPQPEIGDGYRPATWADAGREDREVFYFGAWVAADPGITNRHHIYRVPVDRIPTDNDAIGRPTVMVLDGVSGAWAKASLLAVTSDDTYPFCALMDGVVDSWMDCRFPYPGELD